jgi:hypothetical protein
MKIWATALFFGLMMAGLGGCYQVTGYDQNYKVFTPPLDDRALVIFQWVEDVDEVHAKCPYKAIVVGCAIPEFIPAPGSSQVRIYRIFVQRPKDFNDGGRLAVLGHEVFHALGADHERPVQ